MKKKLQSPVVWAAVVTCISAQLELLRQNGADGWSIAIAVCTVLITLFGALNNPNDRQNF